MTQGVSPIRKRILIVDDDPTYVAALARALELSGYEVATADNGARAKEVLDREIPDVILLDILMPELDGLRLLRILKEEKCPCPVLVVTSVSKRTTYVEAMVAGATDVLVKPFSFPHLLKKLETVA